MAKYNIGELWWVQFPFEETNDSKHRPAIVIDDHTLAVIGFPACGDGFLPAVDLATVQIKTRRAGYASFRR